MTDEQFKQLMEKLDAIERRLPVNPNSVHYLSPQTFPGPQTSQPWQPQYGDQFPWHWRGGTVD